LKDEKTKKFFLEEFKKDGKAAGFFGFELPMKVHLTSHVFTIENDILTPTFKVKRDKAKAYFLKEIKEMYDGAMLQGEEK
jgi:long-chain acyl-CoA synthetase